MTIRRYQVATIPGDGIGPEVVAAAIKVIDYVGSKSGFAIEWSSQPWGSDFFLATGAMMPPDGIDRLRPVDAILLGAVGDPRVPDHVTLHGLLLPIRRQFDQYLCLRPARLLPGVTSALRNARPGSIDMLIVRENTEGEYADIGGRLYRGTDAEVALQTNVFTRRGCRRIIEAAFDAAARRRRHVTSVTKSNAQAFGMVLWDEVFWEVAAHHPDVETRSILVDAAAMDLVRRPESFDVIVGSNLFGDILSDLAAAVVGGLGLTPSANINPSREFPSMFEPVHGSAPDIAGKGIANPMATVLAGAMMLEHLGESAAAADLSRAVEAVLAAGAPSSPDLGGSAGTDQVADGLIEVIRR